MQTTKFTYTSMSKVRKFSLHCYQTNALCHLTLTNSPANSQLQPNRLLQLSSVSHQTPGAGTKLLLGPTTSLNRLHSTLRPSQIQPSRRALSSVRMWEIYLKKSASTLGSTRKLEPPEVPTRPSREDFMARDPHL